MVIKKAAFICSRDRFAEFPGQGLPEIALVGKSNVGKSSLINRLTGYGHLAKTSGQPGKTRLINLYNINDQLVLVDLPGYGFAKVEKMEKARWAGMIEGFLTHSPNLKHVFQLVDIRHAPTREDVTMVEYLRHYGLPFTVIATKADKLSKAQRGRSIPVIVRALAVQPWEIVTFSAEDGAGRDRLLEIAEGIISTNLDSDAPV